MPAHGKALIKTDLAVATPLDRADEAKTVVDDIAATAEDIAASHLEFEDTTYTFANVEKSSVDYLSYDGSDSSFFTGLGLLPSTSAKEYTADEHEVKKSQVDRLDADVLFIHFPDGREQVAMDRERKRLSPTEFSPRPLALESIETLPASAADRLIGVRDDSHRLQPHQRFQCQ